MFVWVASVHTARFCDVTQNARLAYKTGVSNSLRELLFVVKQNLAMQCYVFCKSLPIA